MNQTVLFIIKPSFRMKQGFEDCTFVSPRVREQIIWKKESFVQAIVSH